MYVAPEIADILTPRARLQRMLDVEAALARAEAKIGVIPADAAAAIAAACHADQYDLEQVERDSVTVGTHAVALVDHLRALVHQDSRRFVHWGATSQDLMDTATSLEIRDGVA